MNHSPQKKIAEIDQEIERLMTRRLALHEAMEAPWPKRLTLYAYCSKDTNWEYGEKLGLTGEALRLFVHFEEIALEVEVAEDGMVTVLACNGKRVEQDTEERR